MKANSIAYFVKVAIGYAIGTVVLSNTYDLLINSKRGQELEYDENVTPSEYMEFTTKCCCISLAAAGASFLFVNKALDNFVSDN